MDQDNFLSSVVTEALPEPKNAKKKTPVFVPPELQPGEIGGYVVDRTDAQELESWQWPSTAVPFHVRHFWNPRLGRVEPWFDVELQGPSGATLISLAQQHIYELRLGDWITVHKFVQDNVHAVAKRVTILKVPHEAYDMEFDVSWLGPATECAGEGKIGRGIDATDRRVFFTWNAYKGYFGARVRKRDRVVQTEEYVPAVRHAIGGSFYGTLGLVDPPPPSTDEDVKKAYRDKSKQVHPDLNPDDPSAGTKFQELKDAYDMLIDSAGRAAYDMFMDLTQQTYAKNNKDGVGPVRLRVGKFKEVWYPPITSGKIKCSATLVGNTVLVDNIEEIEIESLGNKTRICAPVDGIPTLLWGLNV